MWAIFSSLQTLHSLLDAALPHFSIHRHWVLVMLCLEWMQVLRRIQVNISHSSKPVHTINSSQTYIVHNAVRVERELNSFRTIVERLHPLNNILSFQRRSTFHHTKCISAVHQLCKNEHIFLAYTILIWVVPSQLVWRATMPQTQSIATVSGGINTSSYRVNTPQVRE